ncbi:MAG: shikimate dehydrogenase [Bacteroidaceae bacterium]|nr:shikimate dehydrogenase [Bacteroidaceae bacterium]
MKKTYGIIGTPLAQSASPAFFNKKFADENIDAQYLPFELSDINELPGVLEEHPTLRGFNVTIPYKLQVMDYLEDMSPEAKGINAVNVVKVTYDSDGKPHLRGYNSDVIGFSRSISPLLGPDDKQALVLGTGGASKAIIYALRQLGLKVQPVSRTASATAIAYSDITPEIIATHTVIVNCTPLGMVGHGVDLCPDIPYELLTDRHILYDIVYNPENTLFLQKGREYGARTKSGYEMWYLQALASWEIWNNDKQDAE